ncbi:MAG: GTP-binding protein [Gammaproteobacteria bacterium]|nr:GTP-binding protein [Gammaproteobacteria bacterium]
MTAPLDFFVLTGFLGSGKTTLLRDFLATPAAADTAVIVNEVGEIALDGAILSESGRDVPMAMLANGCICCRMGSDLAVTIGALIEAKQAAHDQPAVLKRIVLETSGLSKPGPILRQLADLAYLRLRVAVVTTYDAVKGTDVATFDEATAQWAAAHRIVITKLDCVSPQRAADAAVEVATLNSLAEIVAATDRAVATRAAFSPLNAPAAVLTPPATPQPRGHDRIAVRLVMPVVPPTYDHLAAWLDNVAGTLGDRLLRLKGLVSVSGSERPLLIQSVGTMFSEPRPFGRAGEAHRSFIVVIVRDLQPGELEAVAPTGVFLVMR